MHMLRTVLITTALIFVTPLSITAAEMPDVQPLLDAGQLEEAERVLVEHLDTHNQDHDARLALGTVRMMQAVQQLSADFFSFGPQEFPLPLFRMSLPQNEAPEVIRHGDLQRVFDRFVDRLDVVETTLAPIGDEPAKWVLCLDTVRLDLDGSGKAEDDEMLAPIINRLSRGALQRERVEAERRASTQPAMPPIDPKDYLTLIALDTTDAYWMRAYTHLLRGFADLYRAHNTRELFNRTGHLLFAKPDTPYPFLVPSSTRRLDFPQVADAIALIHLINLPVESPERMASSLGHFERAIVLSREMWEAALAETDNDREWLPAPGQDSVIPARINEARLKAWMETLDEAEAVLSGEKLIPFWRAADPPLGVNLRRAFTEPQRFDLVLWVQGTGAAPYLEADKPMTTGGFWRRINRQFGGNLMGFAFFIN
ncbi:MAG: hypothetical protein AAGI68_06630 [Planctomycetota bacterium]